MAVSLAPLTHMKPVPSKTGLPHLDLASREKGFFDGSRGNVWWPGPGTEPLSYTVGYREAGVRNPRTEPDAGAGPRSTRLSRIAGSHVTSADKRRLLELLAGSADGATDVLLAGCDFSPDLIVGMVRAGLVTATAERTIAAGKPVEASRVRITEAGRERLLHASNETTLLRGGLSGGPGRAQSRTEPVPGAELRR